MFSGVLLKQFREAAGLTQQQLADASGVSRVTIGTLETDGKQQASLPTLVKLAGVLNRKVEDFLTE